MLKWWTFALTYWASWFNLWEKWICAREWTSKSSFRPSQGDPIWFEDFGARNRPIKKLHARPIIETGKLRRECFHREAFSDPKPKGKRDNPPPAVKWTARRRHYPRHVGVIFPDTRVSPPGILPIVRVNWVSPNNFECFRMPQGITPACKCEAVEDDGRPR